MLLQRILARSPSAASLYWNLLNVSYVHISCPLSLALLRDVNVGRFESFRTEIATGVSRLPVVFHFQNTVG